VAHVTESMFPGGEWAQAAPSSMGLDSRPLDVLRDRMQGRGCIVRHGRVAYSWGDVQSRADVWSACKPVVTHFLFDALMEGLIPGLDELAATYESRLLSLNASLDYKDRKITLAHMGNQISCYGVEEAPGSAFDYNDWQMALFIDILFLRIYGAAYEAWDSEILHPKLTDRIRCQDNPTLLTYGPRFRQGRLAMSLRDFARFGLLYMHSGEWNGTQVIDRSLAEMAVTSPLPVDLPRAGVVAAEMIPGQRSLGSEQVPDNQNDHYGSYSWCWWINGTDASGTRFLGNAPPGAYCALGDDNDRRGMAVIPEHGIVFTWNDTGLDVYPADPRPLDECMRLLMEAIG
jgi:CubicO group peptidase (beta-lactamase class C family)